MNSRQMNTPYASCARIECGRAYGGLRSEQREGLSQFLVERSKRKRAIVLPPANRLLDVRFGAPGDPNPHGY